MENILLNALWHIANFPSGGVVEQGEPSGDRSEMLHTARQALMEYYDVKTFSACQQYRPQ